METSDFDTRSECPTNALSSRPDEPSVNDNSSSCLSSSDSAATGAVNKKIPFRFRTTVRQYKRYAAR